MFTIAALLAAATLTAGTVPAPAPASAPASAPAPTAVDVASAAPAKASTGRYAVRYDATRDLYCVRDREAGPATGTMLDRAQCKSSDYWASQGLTVGRKH